MTQEERDEKLEQVKEMGGHVRGRNDYIRFLKGEKLTLSERILANCYECNGFYADGRADCECDSCPFYEVNPCNPAKVAFRAPSDLSGKATVVPETGSKTIDKG